MLADRARATNIGLLDRYDLACSAASWLVLHAGLSIKLYHPHAAPGSYGGSGNSTQPSVATRVCSLHMQIRDAYHSLLAYLEHKYVWQAEVIWPSLVEGSVKHRRLRHRHSLNGSSMDQLFVQSYVAEDGCLHIVAAKDRIQDAVANLDLSRARLLTRLSLFWIQRVRCGLPSLRDQPSCPWLHTFMRPDILRGA